MSHLQHLLSGPDLRGCLESNAQVHRSRIARLPRVCCAFVTPCDSLNAYTILEISNLEDTLLLLFLVNSRFGMQRL